MTAQSAVFGVGGPSGIAPPDHLSSAHSMPFVRKQGEKFVLDITVRGAKCGGCLSKIESAAGNLPGVSESRLNLSTGRMRIKWSGELSSDKIIQTITDLGYGASVLDPERDADVGRQEERRLLVALGVAGFAAANIMLLSISVWAGTSEMGHGTRQLLHAISGAIAVPAVLFAGRPFFSSAWSVLRKGRANMDVPISLAVVLALTFSLWETAKGGEVAYFDACVMLLFFLLIGRFLDARLRRRSHAAALDLAAMQSHTATRINRDGTTQTVRAQDIRAGDVVLVPAGERAMVDLEVVAGTSDIDESLVTGESVPRIAAPGSPLYAGTIVLGQALRGRALSGASDSLMADIARMLEAGEQRRSAYRRIADRAVSLYVPLVHTVAALTFSGWLLAGANLREALFVAISTLIITCPCALALAAPVAQVVAAARLFKSGIFLKSGDALERIAEVDHIVFDKTGTLTLGVPVLRQDDLDRTTIERAAMLARASRHPLSRAIVSAAAPGHVADNVCEYAGLGLEGEIDGVTCRLGSSEWVNAGHSASNGPVLWFSEGEAKRSLFRFEDQLRDDAAQMLAGLSARGITTEILSGDRQAAVAEVARKLDISHWTANADPSAKVVHLEGLKNQGRKVLMVGDGLNDAGALALAHASLAPGGAMDVSQSASDAVYAGSSLTAILTAIDTAVHAKRTMLQNFAFAAAYNLVAIPIAVAGLASPLIAAIAMSASSLIVTVNALRQSLRIEGKS